MARIEIDCEGGPIVIEADDNGITIYGIDVEAERAAKAIGFDPSPCLVALDNDLIVNAKYGHADVVELLLAAGADVHARNDNALGWAAGNGHARVAKILLAAGADVHADNDLPLQWAARYGHADVVELLLAAGADVHAVGDYALEIAGDHDDADVVKVLEEWIEEHG